MQRKFDVIVFGATGFTGRLVAEYLNTAYGVGGDLAWAMAGRSLARLTQVRDALGIDAALPLLVADALDGAALAALVAQARVVITTVGPYQRHGEALVSACARAGTDYVDLCGEPGWMAQMIPRLQGPAAASGARIVFSCGFDSIPFDLGVVFLQGQAQARLGAPLVRVHGRVKVMKGGFSGGTAASLIATLEAAGRDAALARTLVDPFALTPGFRGPPQPDDRTAAWDDLAQSWTGPFVMAPINTKNVHRTHALRGHPWGRDFTYSERMLTGTGAAGERRAKALARTARLQDWLLRLAPARALIRRFVLPQPGQGPGKAQRDSGRYEVVFVGQTASGQTLRATVRGDRDPGYGSTCKLISESALCLLQDVDRTMTPGGVWTPGAAMGLTLVRRLQERAGLQFAVDAA
ncbi:MAG: saccharopine dehydrogenase NADP-binding domain-containing protein [Burkholderiaceae bacterium]|uniref:saccharopine dehydrogenase family protein n=1 Tax=Hydrogenophaga sp. TaxID=1904254 RepID=UPI00274C7C16|nr:saccharopine dehydrogenase NADP-binding domain-containing protein [Hydrogenophaga sp.]MDP2066039.1 saccharopine dehydrogenase NADP-binding domain-containing protein [Burkholderiaceae bacterium]MDZ4399917.1 saccharopine dehydrogenase NADP-binding domain-containing protein [Hydrogenophaga sp.]